MYSLSLVGKRGNGPFLAKLSQGVAGGCDSYGGKIAISGGPLATVAILATPAAEARGGPQKTAVLYRSSLVRLSVRHLATVATVEGGRSVTADYHSPRYLALLALNLGTIWHQHDVVVPRQHFERFLYIICSAPQCSWSEPARIGCADEGLGPLLGQPIG